MTDVSTHNVQSVTVTEVKYDDWKTMTLTIVATVVVWCDKTNTHRREPVKYTHTLFTNELDLKFEFQESEE